MIRHLWTSLWRLFLLVGLFLAALLTPLMLMLVTPGGSRFFLEQILPWRHHFLVVWRSGSIDGYLRLQRFDWQSQNFHLALEDVTVESDFSRLLRARLPIQRLTIARAELDLPWRPPHKTLLKTLWTPIELTVDQLHIGRLTLHKVDHFYTAYDLHAKHLRWGGHDLRVRQLTLNYPGWHLDLSGRLQLRGDYPLQAFARCSGSWLSGHGMTPWTLELTKSVADLQVHGWSGAGDAVRQARAQVSTTLPGLPYRLQLSWRHLPWPWWPRQQLSSAQAHISLAGTTQGYRMAFDLLAQGRYLWPGRWQGQAHGDRHHLAFDQLDYAGLAGRAQARGDIAFAPAYLHWQLDLQAQNVHLSQRWPALQWLLPRLQGRWRTQGLSTPQASSWQVDGDAGGGEIWHLQAAQAGALARQDLPLQMQLQIQKLQRLWAGRRLTLRHVQGVWRGPWQRHDWRLRTDVAMAAWPQAHLQASGWGNGPHLELQQAQVQGDFGRLNFVGRATWRQGPSWQGELSGENLTAQDWFAGMSGAMRLQAQVQGYWRHAQADLSADQLHLDGVLRGQPIIASATHLQGQRGASWRGALQGLQVLWGSNQGRVDVIFDRQLHGHVQVDAPDLSLLGWVQRGALHLDWHLRSADAWGGYGRISVEHLERPALTWDTALWQVAAGNAGQAHLTVQQLRWHGWRIDRLESRADGSWRQADVHNVAQIGSLLWQGQTQLQATPQGWQGQMLAGKIQDHGMNWSLREPFAWSYEQAHLDIAPHCWVQDQASLCLLHSARIGRQGELSWRLSDLPAQSLQGWMPAGVLWRGLLQGSGDARWQDAHPLRVQAELGSSGGELALHRDHGGDLRLPYQQAHMALAMLPDGVDVHADLVSHLLGQMQLVAHVLPSAPHAIDGHLSIDHLDLRLLQPFLPRVRDIGGILDASTALAGDVLHPIFTGEAHWQQGHLQDRHALFNLQNMQGEARFDHDHADFSAHFQSGRGQGQIQGRAHWQGQDWSLRGQLSGQDLQLIHPPLLHSRLSPQIDFHLHPRQLELKGTVQVLAADIQILDQAHGSLEASPDVIRRGETVSVSGQPWHLVYDVQLQLGNSVNFKGFGADGRLHGHVDLTQDEQGIRTARGEIDLDPESSFRAYGQNLRIRKGRLLFVGPPTMAQVDVEAIKEFDPDITVGVKVQGWSNQLQSTLISDNGLSPDEISSYLIFGHAPERQQALFGVNNNTNIPPGGIPGLGAPVPDSKIAALQIGAFGGQKVADTVGATIGVRDLALTTEGAGTETQMALGGYVSPNLYLSYGVGVFTPVNSLTLRYRINQHFYLQAASAFQNAIDMFYTFKF